MAVVLLPAVGYGHSTGHRMLWVLAEALAARGCTAVRIDLPGNRRQRGRRVLSGLRPWAETLTADDRAASGSTSREDVKQFPKGSGIQWTGARRQSPPVSATLI